MPLRGRSNLADARFFFVTTTLVLFANIFAEDRYCDILVHNIKHYQERYRFVILGYVIMPSHFHWIVEVDPERGTISDIMRDIKKYSAWDILSLLKEEGRTEFDAVFKAEAAPYRDQEKKVWMKRFHDEAIRNQEMFLSRLHYIHNNPVEAGLVDRPEQYKYSSARNFILGDDAVLHVDTGMAVGLYDRSWR